MKMQLRFLASPCMAWLLMMAFAVSVCQAQEEKSTKAKRGSKEQKSQANVEAEPSTANVSYYAPRKMEMQFGLRFLANDNQCTQLLATLPFPTDWPEQKVKVLRTSISPNTQHQFRPVPGGAMQLVLQSQAVAAGGSFEAVIFVEVEKSFIKPPEDPSTLVIPKRVPKDLNWFMGESPYIETQDRQLRKIITDIKAQQPENAWRQIELYYDWVRDNIEYRNGDIRSTKVAIKEKWGDCEEMTSVFVALCRASNVPARMVWVPDHCYAEFYLEEEPGKGYWFPCQLAGDRQFGEMKEYRPILQKGDRFKVPEKKKLQRYVDEFFKCQQQPVGPKEPQVIQLRDLGALQQELDQLKASSPQLFGGSNSGGSDAKSEDKSDESVKEDSSTSDEDDQELDTGVDDGQS